MLLHSPQHAGSHMNTRLKSTFKIFSCQFWSKIHFQNEWKSKWTVPNLARCALVLKSSRLRSNPESVAWRLDSILGTVGSARQVQTDLREGIWSRRSGKLGHTGICGPQSGVWMSSGPTSRRLLPRPIGPAATGGVQILGISCCAGSCQSVTTCLCAGLASRLAVWQVFGLCVCVCVCIWRKVIYPWLGLLISQGWFLIFFSTSLD